MRSQERDQEGHRIEQKFMDMSRQTLEYSVWRETLPKRYSMVGKRTAKMSEMLRRRYVLTDRHFCSDKRC